MQPKNAGLSLARDPDYSGAAWEPEPDMSLLFVYGTLLTDAGHEMGRLLQTHGVVVGKGSIRGRLYIIDDPDCPGARYPGALPSAIETDRVHGEVHRIEASDKVWQAFDAYEGCSPEWAQPYEFLRRTVPVVMDDGMTQMAQCYLYTWDVTHARHIPSGRFAGALPL